MLNLIAKRSNSASMNTVLDLPIHKLCLKMLALEREKISGSDNFWGLVECHILRSVLTWHTVLIFVQILNQLSCLGPWSSTHIQHLGQKAAYTSLWSHLNPQRTHHCEVISTQGGIFKHVLPVYSEAMMMDDNGDDHDDDGCQLALAEPGSRQQRHDWFLMLAAQWTVKVVLGSETQVTNPQGRFWFTVHIAWHTVFQTKKGEGVQQGSREGDVADYTRQTFGRWTFCQSILTDTCQVNYPDLLQALI